MIPGLKVHWRDVDRLLARPWPAAPRLLEVHLEPRDVAEDRARVVDAFAPLSDRYLVALHQPFVLADGRALDPLAADAGARRASLSALAAAGDLAADVDASFLILHPGGMRRAGEPDPAPLALRAFLEALESPAPVLLENMPAWYHFPDGETGRSRFARTPEEFAEVDDLVAGWCFDTCHAWGATGSEAGARAFLPHASRIQHVHASDGAPPAREGVPLGEGGLAPELFAELERAVGPRVACVPEIHGGHLEPARTAAAFEWLAKAGCYRTV